MKILFISYLNVNNKEMYGGARASAVNYNALKEFAEVDLYYFSKRSSIHSMLSLILGHFPPILPHDLHVVNDMIKKNKYDAVFLNSSNLGDFAKIARKYGTKIITFYHNCEADYIKVRFSDGNSFKQKLYQKLVNSSEQEIAEISDMKIVFTMRDKKRIENLYKTKVDMVIPICMMDTFKQRGENTKGNYCLLLGPLGAANEEAFGWFVNNVSPFINCKTVIAGKGFEKYKEDWTNENVEVKGYVENLDEVYNNAACVVIPLFSGGGMKIKTVEALMYGKYIFGTDEAFVGFDFDYSKIGGLCNNEAEFIEAINYFLINEKDHYNEYSRMIYEQQHSIQAGVAAFRNVKNFINGKCK